MNKHGDIVGTMFLNDRGPGFIWPHGTLTELGVERFPSVLGVNANREVIGNLYNGEGFLGYHWRDGLTTPIGGTVGFRDTRAVAINEAGQIAGTFSNDFNESHVFLWQTGVFTNLSAPATFPTVRALNDAGKVVGTAIYPDDNRRYPTMWTVFGSTRLGTRHGTPLAINSRGQVLINTDGPVVTPFIWTDGAVTNLDLRTSGGHTTTASALNDLGQSAGNSGPFDISRAVFWNADGSAVDLTGGLLRTTSSTAFGLNNRGQVVGSYVHGTGETRAVLWTLTWGHSDHVADADPH